MAEDRASDGAIDTSNRFLFAPPAQTSVPLADEPALYPIRRIFCVGRNYAAHAREMGSDVTDEAPFYFTKTPAAVVPNGASVPYPPGTADFHHEVELYLAISAPLFRADAPEAELAVLGYGCALDMTRRDLQTRAKSDGLPWDLSKDFAGSAVLAPLRRATELGPLGDRRIWLDVNDDRRQDARLSEMTHSSVEIVADLSRYYRLGPGDLILTGTPAGVSAVSPGDRLAGGIEGLPSVSLTIATPE